MNMSNNNIILIIFLLIIIPIYIAIVVLNRNNISRNIYSLIIIIMSVSLVLLMGMRSSHIIGADSNLEYYIFMQTLSHGKWQILINSTLDSCLSISILPVVYYSFLNINPEYIFKMLYPILFSISPLIIYIIAKNYFCDIYAFFASFFYMSQTTFLCTTSNSRTTIAILFFALSIMILINNRLPEYIKRLLLICFIFSCIVSHYSTTYIFFGIIFFSFITMQLFYILFVNKKLVSQVRSFLSHDKNIAKLQSSNALTAYFRPYLTPGIISIFFIVIFVWYSQITSVAFNDGVGFIYRSMQSLQDLFILESRRDNVVVALGSGVDELELPRKIAFVFNWLNILFIAVGVFAMSFLYQKRAAFLGQKIFIKSNFLINELDIFILNLSIISSSIMVASILVPFISRGYGLDRIYLLTTIILSLSFILGGITFAEIFHIRYKYLVMLIVLVPFFMCTTGIVHQLFGYPGSIILNSEGNSFDKYYIYDKETYACSWLSEQSVSGQKYYADYFGNSRLISQGEINRDSIENVVGHWEQNRKNRVLDGYIYLRNFNVAKGKLFGPKSSDETELRKYWPKLIKDNKIYNNGGSEVWR